MTTAPRRVILNREYIGKGKRAGAGPFRTPAVKKMKNVIHIFGASGSGTSTLGRAIGEKAHFRVMDTDDYFWLPTDPPFTEKRPEEERLRLMQKDIDEADNAVISGALCGWGDPLIGRFTLAVRLIVPAAVRIARLKAREYQRFGSRVLEGGDLYEAHQAFYEWAASYDTGDVNRRSRAHHDQWQRKLPCKLLVLDGTLPTAVLAETVMREIG